jgi:tryptophanyl-tRNA synthetase
MLSLLKRTHPSSILQTTKYLSTTTTTKSNHGNNNNNKKTITILSGIQPTGIPHLGNYLGALREWRNPTEDINTSISFYSIMDLHALTIPENTPPNKLKQDVLIGIATMLACGLKNSPHCSLFVQSSVPQHCELAWILGCITPLGMLERQVQFKDKIATNSSHNGATLGLLSYPVLMAADILLYRANVVPVGHDQVQHLELSREIVLKFKNIWGYSFPSPQCKLGPSQRVMSLADATKKMSKSHREEYSRIVLTDDADTIRRKIQRAKTDSIGPITIDDPNRIELNNLIDIYVALLNKDHIKKTELEIKSSLQGLTMNVFKPMLIDALVQELCPLGQEINSLLKDPGYLNNVVEIGRQGAFQRAEETMTVIRKVVGLR